jgi:hypothetical protein
MKHLLILLVILFFVSSCDKEKKTTRRIDGTWEIKSFKRILSTGISIYADVTGEMKIETSNDEYWEKAYTLQFDYAFPSLSGSTNQSGLINVLESGEYMDVSTLNSADVVTRIDNHRIMVLTSTDLQLEFTDSVGQINTYTFRKK